MKNSLIALALASASLLPLAASAQEATPEPAQAASLKSRADVTAELYGARKNGEMKVVRAGYIGEAPAAPRSRADVMAELQQARSSGELAKLQAEAQSFDRSLPDAASSRLAQVR